MSSNWPDPPAERREEVDHPKHYNTHPSGIECIEIVEDLSFNLGNAIKYLWRAGLKPGVNVETDLRKAIWYIDREISRRRARAASGEQPVKTGPPPVRGKPYAPCAAHYNTTLMCSRPVGHAGSHGSLRSEDNL